MTRAELLARMTSQELSGWRAWFTVKHDEDEAAAEQARHVADSDDGQVVELNKPPRRFDDEDDDGEAE